MPTLQDRTTQGLDAWIAAHLELGPDWELLFADLEIVIMPRKTPVMRSSDRLEQEIRVEYLVPLRRYGREWRSALIRYSRSCGYGSGTQNTTLYSGHARTGEARRWNGASYPLTPRQLVMVVEGQSGECERARVVPLDAAAYGTEAPGPRGSGAEDRRAWAETTLDLAGWSAPAFDNFKMMAFSEDIERLPPGLRLVKVRTELYEPRYIPNKKWREPIDFFTRSQLISFEVDCERRTATVRQQLNYPRRNLKGEPTEGSFDVNRYEPAPFATAPVAASLLHRACLNRG